MPPLVLIKRPVPKARLPWMAGPGAGQGQILIGQGSEGVGMAEEDGGSAGHRHLGVARQGHRTGEPHGGTGLRIDGRDARGKTEPGDLERFIDRKNRPGKRERRSIGDLGLTGSIPESVGAANLDRAVVDESRPGVGTVAGQGQGAAAILHHRAAAADLPAKAQGVVPVENQTRVIEDIADEGAGRSVGEANLQDAPANGRASGIRVGATEDERARPDLAMASDPLVLTMTPPNVLVTSLLPTVSEPLPLLLVTMPLPVSPFKVSLNPATSRMEFKPTFTSPLPGPSGMTLLAPSLRVPNVVPF